MRLGVLDVGSNTVHLLVVDAYHGAHPWPAYSEKAELRLAERIGADGRLSRTGADALVGKAAYDKLSELCSARAAQGLVARHPATPADEGYGSNL